MSSNESTGATHYGRNTGRVAAEFHLPVSTGVESERLVCRIEPYHGDVTVRQAWRGPMKPFRATRETALKQSRRSIEVIDEQRSSFNACGEVLSGPRGPH
jgi:hypothetical protein